MAPITAHTVRALREKSGAGMMDCKKALEENDSDLEKASDWLRQKGLSAARKKAGRSAAEGLVGMRLSDNKGVLIEINSETDFVSRNDLFQNFVEQCSIIALESDGTKDAILATAWKEGGSVQEALTQQIARIGEHMDFRRVSLLHQPQGIVSGYIHGAVKSGMGRIGVLVSIQSDKITPELSELGRQLAMHIAATQPEYLSIDDVSDAAREKEKAFFTAQAKEQGKSAEIIEKMIEGRLRKFYEEIVLNEQIFVIDGKTRIRDLLGAHAKKYGCVVQLAGFKRMAVGDGIKREESDFAAEVTKTLQG